MKIGNYRLKGVDTGRFRLDGGAMFGVIPKVLWQRTNPPDDKNRIELALRTLVLDDGKRKAIVDTGIGTKFDPKSEKIFAVDHSQLNLETQLQKAGYKREDITDVILTHLHFDHAGGNTYKKNGELHLTFPNATYHVDQFHYEWAMRPTKRDQASFLRDNFEFLEKKGVLRLYDGSQEEVIPGIPVLKVHGHTPHMCLPKISDGKTTVLYCADLIPTSSHIPLPYIMGYDLNALETLQEKEIILKQAQDEDWILFFEHDPKHSAARIEKTERQDYQAREYLEI